MHTITPTALRQTLFHELENVIQGEPVRIKTKHGNVLMIREENTLQTGRAPSRTPNIKGRIIGNLHDADTELLEYLDLPE